jgi:hypothetical protein
VCDKEWSFGYCENGTGVFCCPPAMNPMYTHRESIVLGHIFLSRRHIGQILLELSQEWNGSSYDPLSRNCNHFCDALCERLGVQKLPLWVNRFANAGEAAVEAAGNTMEKVQSLIFCLFFCLEFCAPISEERALPVSVQKGSSRIGVGFAR